jgi:6,7-dimethyl-8-ribityllumazine synthase
MAGRGPQADSSAPRQGAQGVERARILIIDAPYYQEIAEALLAGATSELDAAGATYERIVVPGALEIPVALAQAVVAGLIPDCTSNSNARFDGCVALGCVIRGETSHYDTVCNNANYWLMEIATHHAIPLGNAILTVENEAQALERARGGRESKGGGAVRACLTLIELARAFASDRP